MINLTLCACTLSGTFYPIIIDNITLSLVCFLKLFMIFNQLCLFECFFHLYSVWLFLCCLFLVSVYVSSIIQSRVADLSFLHGVHVHLNLESTASSHLLHLKYSLASDFLNQQEAAFWGLDPMSFFVSVIYPAETSLSTSDILKFMGLSFIFCSWRRNHGYHHVLSQIVVFLSLAGSLHSSPTR